MPQAAVLGLAMVVGAVCLRARVDRAATCLLATMVLIPDSLVVPHGPSWLTVVRVALWATAAGLGWRVLRGEVAWSSLRPGRTHLVLAAFVVFAFVVGVAGGPYPARFSTSFQVWLGVVDQLVLFGCVVAFARLLGARWVATRLVAAVAVGAAIAVGERLTDGSYAHFWLAHNPGTRSIGPGGALERRGSSSRVRAAAEFALQYGWTTATAVPLACALAVRSRRRLLWLVPALLVVAVVLTVSRSVFAGLAVAALVLIVVSRFDRRAVVLVVLAGMVGVVGYLGTPSLRRAFTAAGHTDSVTSRAAKLRAVSGLVEPRPYGGLGLSGLAAVGIESVDDAYATAYAALGVLGLVLLVTALLVPVVSATAGLVRRRGGSPPRDHLVGAAAVAGVATAILSGGAYDALSGATSAWMLWAVAAIAVVAAEATPEGAVPGPELAGSRAGPGPAAGLPGWRWFATRLSWPVVGALLGLLIMVSTPARVSGQSTFLTMGAEPLARSPGDVAQPSRILDNAVCATGTAAVAGLPVQVLCGAAPAGPGVGSVRIAGGSIAVVDAAFRAFDQAAPTVDRDYLRDPSPYSRGRSTFARTAPAWGAELGLILAGLLPRGDRRRRRRLPTMTVAA